MCNYRCPHAERKKCAGFLLCRLLYKEGVNYGIRENAMNAICAHQKQCAVTGIMENTDEAKRCALAHPETAETTYVPADPEEPEETPKTRKKK